MALGVVNDRRRCRSLLSIILEYLFSGKHVTKPLLTPHKRVRLRTFSTFNFSPKNASFPVFFVILIAEEGATFSELKYAEIQANESGIPAAHNASFVSMERLSRRRSAVARERVLKIKHCMAEYAQTHPARSYRSIRESDRFAPRGHGSGRIWSWQHRQCRSVPAQCHYFRASHPSQSCNLRRHDNTLLRSGPAPKTRDTWSGEKN